MAAESNAPAMAPESVGSPAADPGQALSSGQATEPYFVYSRYDGTKDEFASKEDLAKAWRESYLRQQDYTKKTQSHAEEVKKHKAEREEFERQRKEFQERSRQIMEWDKQLKARPDLERQLMSLAGQGPVNQEGIGNLVDERTKELVKRLESIESERERERLDSSVREAYSSVERELGEWFNKDAVDEMMNAVDENDPVAMIRLMAWAAVGRNSINGPAPTSNGASAQIKQEKGKARLVSNGSVPQAANGFGSTQEAHQAALREWAGINPPRG